MIKYQFQSTNNQQIKHTKAAARHLRRKKLKQARKVEKHLVKLEDIIESSKKNAVESECETLKISSIHRELSHEISQEQTKINICKTVNDVTEVPNAQKQLHVVNLALKSTSKNNCSNSSISIEKNSISVNEVPCTKYLEPLFKEKLTADVIDSSTATSAAPTTTEKSSSSAVASSQISKMIANEEKSAGKSRDQIKAEREAKKAAKAALKVKSKKEKSEKNENVEKGGDVPLEAEKENKKSTTESIKQRTNKNDAKETSAPFKQNVAGVEIESKSKAGDLQGRNSEVPLEGKKENKKKGGAESTRRISENNDVLASKETSNSSKQNNAAQVEGEGKSKAELRAERRAKQEAQRAAKLQQLAKKPKGESNKLRAMPCPAPVTQDINQEIIKKPVVTKNSHEVSLFKHLYHERELALKNAPIVNSKIHPAIIRLGVQYANKVIIGSNARCVALLEAVKQLINDFERPLHADFVRSLEAALQDSAVYLHHCRPLAVSMQNALRHFKWQMTQLPTSLSDENAKERLKTAIETYFREQIDLASEAISATIQSKISNGNVILTYGYSSLVQKILLDAHKKGKQFRVVVVDGRPMLEGKEQLRRLTKSGIDCTYILINALSFIMPEVSKVLLGAHAILANGAVMSRVGTAQVALMARAYNVPVLVACETHKSCERVQTDSIVYNELGDADELTKNMCCNSEKTVLANWRTKKNLNLLNITYDVTPADLVTAVVTELAILPCTSVPVILRIKPSEI